MLLPTPLRPMTHEHFAAPDAARDAAHDLDVAIAAEPTPSNARGAARARHLHCQPRRRSPCTAALAWISRDAALRQQAAVVQHEDVVGELAHQAHVVLDHDDGRAAPLAGPADHVDHLRRLLRRESGAGLVEQQQARLAQQRQRQLEDLAFAMRQLRRRCAARRPGTDNARASASQQRAAPAAQARPQQIERPCTAAPQRDGEVVGDRQLREHRRESAACGRCRARRCGASSSRSIARSSKRTLPACAGSSPVSRLKVDVLPAPLGPITQKMPGRVDRQRKLVEDHHLADASRRPRRRAGERRRSAGRAPVRRSSAAARAAAWSQRSSGANRPIRPCGIDQHDDDEHDRDGDLPIGGRCRAARWSARRSAGRPAPVRAGGRARRPRPRSRDRPRARSRTAAASPGPAAARRARHPIRPSSPLTPNATALRRLVSKPNSTTRRSLCASAAHSTPSGARYSQTTADAREHERRRRDVSRRPCSCRVRAGRECPSVR